MSDCSTISEFISALEAQNARCIDKLFKIVLEASDFLNDAESVAETACMALGVNFLSCQAVGEVARELARQATKGLADKARKAGDGSNAAEKAIEDLQGLLSHCEQLPSGPRSDEERNRIVQEAYSIAGQGLQGDCDAETEDEDEDPDWREVLDELLDKIQDILDALPDFG